MTKISEKGIEKAARKLCSDAGIDRDPSLPTWRRFLPEARAAIAAYLAALPVETDTIRAERELAAPTSDPELAKYRAAAASELAAPTSDPAPAGWRMVPVEPTIGMINQIVGSVTFQSRELATQLYARIVTAVPEPPVSEGWQPRATAPKDGTYFLAWVPLMGWEKDQGCLDDGDMRVVWFEGRGKFTSDRDLGDEPFTHWQPLPAAPKGRDTE